MIARLLAAFGIAPGRLKVTARAGTDPDVFPRRRDGEGFDALQSRLVTDQALIGVSIHEAAAAPDPSEARLGVRREDQALLAEGGLWVGGYFFFWALLIRAARDLLMPFRFNASYVSLFLIEFIFLPGISK